MTKCLEARTQSRIHTEHKWVGGIPRKVYTCPGWDGGDGFVEPDISAPMDVMARNRLARGGRGAIDTPPGKFERAARGIPEPEEPAKSTEVARFADVAMYEAEPVDVAAGPQVHLLWMTPDPLGAIAAACMMYEGKVVRDLSAVTDEQRLHYWEQVKKTKLKAPFEFVKFHFMIEGVTRAFTHQMVRQRTAVYAQESLRFAVKSDMPVALPPSLSHTKGGEPLGAEDSQEEWKRNVWDQAIGNIQESYLHLVEAGMPAEDARGLLPHNVLTRLHYSTDLRALLDHAGNRLCTQAQFEWRVVFAKITEAIRSVSVDDWWTDVRGVTSEVYKSALIAEAFAPVCYQTGKCEFKASFDRACSIRERVDENERLGRPSSEWHTFGPTRVAPGGAKYDSVQPIQPAEWLLDPSAARRTQ